MERRQVILNTILEERERQFNLPFSEYDLKNTPSDWLSIIAHYLFDEVFRNGQHPNQEVFEDKLIKAGAVIVAALENIPTMEDRKLFRNDND